MKTLTIRQIGWYFCGTAVVDLWGGGRGQINMEPWRLPYPDGGESTNTYAMTEMIAGINDAGFGCERIESAVVDVYELYEHGIKIFIRSHRISRTKLARSGK